MSRKRQRDLDPSNFHTDSTVQKRPRNYSQHDQKLASLFDDLADDASDVRLKAAKDLLVDLAPDKHPEADVISKVLKRLVRGLCSGRKAARFGFFVALTELLRQHYSIGEEHTTQGLDGVKELVKLMTDITHPEGKVSGQEKRDYLFGRVSAYKSLVQSSILTQNDENLEAWRELLQLICTLAKDIPWLREECGQILCDAIKSLTASESPASPFIEKVLETLVTQSLIKTPEGVAVWLTIRSTFPSYEMPKHVWHKNDPLSTKERQNLSRVMREQFHQSGHDVKAGDTTLKSGSWQPSLNFAWELIIEDLVKRVEGSKDGGDVTTLEKFWIDVVDNGLFSQNSSSERKFWGFQLFSKMISDGPMWSLPGIFSPNLMRCLINHRVDDHRRLHEAATEPLKKMRARVKKEPGAAPTIVTGLLKNNGSISFDRATKTKTVEDLLISAGTESLVEIVDLIKTLMTRPSTEDQKLADNSRQILADLLLVALKSKGVESCQPSIGTAADSSWVRELLLVFVTFAYCKPKHIAAPEVFPIPPISEEGRKMYQSRLSSSLTYLLSLRLDDPSAWPSSTVQMVHSLTKSSKPYELATQADKPILKSLKHAEKLIKSIKENPSDSSLRPTDQAFVLLFSLTVLQIYNGDSDALSLLEELEECHRAIVTLDDASTAFDHLVEVLLAFAAKPAVLFRRMAAQVFSTFSHHLTDAGLQSLIEILLKRESLSGQQELFNQDDPVDDSEEDEELDSDVEVVGQSDAEAREDDESDENDASDSKESDVGTDEHDEELEQFESLLAEALKVPRREGNANETNPSTEDDDESMDDEEMMALEPHLTKIFQERRSETNKRQEKKDARENMINFKRRVLDLLLIYVKQEYASPLAMKLLLPLLQFMRITTDSSLSGKASEILKQYFAACSKNKILPAPKDVDACWSDLKAIHGEAKLDSSKLHGSSCSRASLFIVKVLLALEPKNYDAAVDIYTQTQKDWFHQPKTVIQSTFFTEWISWSIEARKHKV